jgi:hypothetical protein
MKNGTNTLESRWRQTWTLGKDSDARLEKYYTELIASHFATPERPECNMPGRQSDSVCGVVSASGIFRRDGLLAIGAQEQSMSVVKRKSKQRADL